MTTAYLNGQYLPLEEARVPVLDRGYLFADGVYEVIPAYSGRVFRLAAHLQRLDRSLAGIRLHNPLPHDQWGTMIERLLQLNAQTDDDLAIYLQVTRGVSATRKHGMPDHRPQPTVLAFTWPLGGVSAQIQEQGVSAITLDDFRWQRCDIKAIALLPNVLLGDEAMSKGHNEAILHRDGRVTEGASSNVFACLDNGRVITPPADEFILHGITREFVIELTVLAGLEIEERALALAELRAANEIWITSSTREVMPVTQLDGAPVGNGQPGEQWQKLYALYQQHKYDSA